MIIDEGKKIKFKFRGNTYVMFKRFYSDGTFDVEVYLFGDESCDVPDEVQDEAEKIMEVL